MLKTLPSSQRCLYAKDSIACLETIIRFMIIVQHDGLSEELFDMFQNHQQLTQYQGSLKEDQYDLVR